MITAKQLANRLHGNEYGHEITASEETQAKDSGLVVIFGYSDDNVELRGVIDDEIGAYEGTTILIAGRKVVDPDHDCECEFCGFKIATKDAIKIHAKWDHNGYSWWIDTEHPHEQFIIYEDGEKFCRGIVLQLPKQGGAA